MHNLIVPLITYYIYVYVSTTRYYFDQNMLFIIINE